MEIFLLYWNFNLCVNFLFSFLIHHQTITSNHTKYNSKYSLSKLDKPGHSVTPGQFSSFYSQLHTLSNYIRLLPYAETMFFHTTVTLLCSSFSLESNSLLLNVYNSQLYSYMQIFLQFYQISLFLVPSKEFYIHTYYYNTDFIVL